MRNHFHLGGTLKRTVLFFLCVPLIGFLCLFLLSCQRTEQAERDYPVVAVPLTEVDITDEFWAPRMEVNRSVSIPYVFKTSLGSAPGESSLIYKTGEGRATVFKTIEGSAYSLAKHPDPELETYIDALTDKIVKELLPQDYEKKWESSYWDRRLYDFGHFFEAAVAYHQATGNSKILDAAVKLANHLDSIYGPEKRHFAPSHEEVEIGLVKLYRQTGNEKYWRLAKFFLDERGNAEGRRSYETWGQDHKPVVEQTEAVGHCVMATYLYISMADMAALSGDSRYSAALDKIWEDVVFRKTHLTGGIGSIRFHEQFGAPYELPNVSCWDETCAAIGNAIWNHRLFLLHCDAKYIDMMERILYNGFLVGVSLKGNRFFYQNDDISAVYDGVDPISSADESSTYFRFRLPEGRPAWVEYEFKKPKEVSSAQVYWVDDRRFCRLPESWRILYKDGSQWKTVKNYEPYGVEKDTFNVVIFEPVKTKAVLLEVEPQKILYKAGSIGPPDALYLHKDIVWRECGIIEWRVK